MNLMVELVCFFLGGGGGGGGIFYKKTSANYRPV